MSPLRGMGLAAFAALALSTQHAAVLSRPPREPRPRVQYIGPRSKRKVRAYAKAAYEKNVERAAFNRGRRHPETKAQRLLSKMTNWQRSQYSRELASQGGGRPDEKLAVKWSESARPSL